MISYSDAVARHVNAFGVEPVITGANYWQVCRLPELILDAIENGLPYEEPPVDPDNFN